MQTTDKPNEASAVALDESALDGVQGGGSVAARPVRAAQYNPKELQVTTNYVGETEKN